VAGFRLFGFTLGKKDLTQQANPANLPIAPPPQSLEDGAITLTSGAYFGTYVDLDGTVRNELELINRYREMALHPECHQAVQEVVSEAITVDTDANIVVLNLDKLKQPDSIKTKILEEFDTIKKLLNFSNLADDLFRRWYIDGRITFHVMVDAMNPRQGIQELRYVDPRKIRKVREIQKGRDPKTGMEVITGMSEYFIFNDRGTNAQTMIAQSIQGIRIAPDAIIQVTSGMMNPQNTMVTSFLHTAIKPLNQLRMIEDALVIYRISRAPERRIFYIDVGNLPKAKAEQYVQETMAKYRNKMVYDASTGELKSDSKHLSMLEDFWLARREGSKGTEISTLPGGQNLGTIDDITYFQKKLYQSLNVPQSRLESQPGGGIGLGRVAEITRDEIKFAKFVNRLRNKFAQIFDQALRVQLSLKGICTIDEWDTFKEDVSYTFESDNNFAEMREAELLRERVNLLQTVTPFVGTYYSQEWVRKHVLQMTDEDVKEIEKQIQAEGPLSSPGMGLEPPMGAASPAAELATGPAPATPAESTPVESGATPMLDAEVAAALKRLQG